MFNELKIGDTFVIEDETGEVKYIKIQEISIYDGGACINAVCIDEYSDKKGQLEFFTNELVSHVNWS